MLTEEDSDNTTAAELALRFRLYARTGAVPDPALGGRSSCGGCCNSFRRISPHAVFTCRKCNRVFCAVGEPNRRRLPLSDDSSPQFSICPVVRNMNHHCHCEMSAIGKCRCQACNKRSRRSMLRDSGGSLPPGKRARRAVAAIPRSAAVAAGVARTQVVYVQGDPQRSHFDGDKVPSIVAPHFDQPYYPNGILPGAASLSAAASYRLPLTVMPPSGIAAGAMGPDARDDGDEYVQSMTSLLRMPNRPPQVTVLPPPLRVEAASTSNPGGQPNGGLASILEVLPSLYHMPQPGGLGLEHTRDPIASHPVLSAASAATVASMAPAVVTPANSGPRETATPGAVVVVDAPFSKASIALTATAVVGVGLGDSRPW